MSNRMKQISGGVIFLLMGMGVLTSFLWMSSRGFEDDRVESAQAGEVHCEVAEASITPPALPAPAALTSVRPTPQPNTESVTLEGEPRPEPAIRDGALRIERFLVASRIAQREPVDASDTFEAGVQRIYAFVHASNRDGETRTLSVTFEPPDGASRGHVELEIPSDARRWRTWAYTGHVTESGEWTAVVRGEDGQVLAQRVFEIVSP